ncbi:MAG TPA: YciI family protein [Polyangiaceae bacterium]|nr:YciI family protein [Polyangiaceae bacterium]
MATQKYLLIQRSDPNTFEPPSAAQMQELYAAFSSWKEKFQANVLDMGGKLKAGGKVLTPDGVTDGPFIGAKEVVGGYMLVVAESYERALEVARECPGLMRSGSSVEIREISTG